MAPMGDDAGVMIAALSQRLRREQSRSQSLQRELQVLRSSEAMTFDIQVGSWTCNMAELLLLNSFFHLKLLKFSSGCG
jgi:hypothetical protein